MTLEEAKKILEEEGFNLKGPGKPGVVSETFAEYESPDVCEAMQVVSSAGFRLAMLVGVFDARKERLKKEYEKNTKAPGSAENRIKEDSDVNPALAEAASQFNDALLDEQAKKIDKQNQEITRLLSLVEKKENSISRLHYEKSVLEKENEALKKGEIPARYFDKALVDEQEEKIKKLEHEKLDILEIAGSCKRVSDEQAKEIKRLGKEIARLNGIIHKKNLKIEELRKESSRHLRGKIKMFGENVDLEQELKDKDAVLADVAEELRLSKIREKNLTELCQKYVKANEELKEKLANNVVDKIDAQALKSAESALAWKEKVVTYKDMALAYYEKKLAEKDEVISNLGKELKAQKDLVDDISLKYDGAKHNLKLRMDECEKLKNELEEKNYLMDMLRNSSKEYCDYGVAANEFIKELAGLYVLANNTGIIKDEMFERCKNYQTYGFPATCNKETKKEIDDIARGKENNKPRISTPEISEEELMKIQEKVVASCDIAEEGGDHSGAVVLCGKDFVKKFKENEEFAFDFFKHRADEADEFMTTGSGVCKKNTHDGDGLPTPEESKYDSIIERCKRLGIELHYHDGKLPTYTNNFGDEVPVYGLCGIFAVCTDEEFKSLYKK